MDYIFQEWEKKLSTFESSVEKDLAEIRKCKAEMQQIKLDVVAELQKGRYVRDTQRLVLSAPEIIIGNVDRSGTLFAGGSKVIVRGTQVGVEGAGEGGRLDLRAPSIREIAEDPGTDGREHVVGSLSEVVSQARNIIIQSDDASGTFSAPAVPTGGSGVRIHADQTIDVHAAMTAESREKRLTDLISETEKQKDYLKEQAGAHKKSFTDLQKELEELIEKRDKLAKDYDNVRTNYREIRKASEEIEALSMSITEETYAYAEILSLLAETNRRLKCFKDEKSKIKKGDDFKKKPTGAAVNITGENINLTSADGENNLRDNKGSGVTIAANTVGITSLDKEGTLNKDGRVSVVAKNIEMATAGAADLKFDDKGKLKKGAFTAEGDFKLTSKNITIEAVDYEVADKKYKEMFGNDEGHLLIIFREYPNASSNYICTATPGYDAETQVMDDQAREILLDYIDYYYTEESFNEGQFFERAFTSAADRIMIKQLSNKQLVTIVAVVAVVVIGIIIVASIIRKKKVAVAKQKAAQAKAEADRKKAEAAQKKTEFDQQKYNDQLETQYVAVICPNCGSTGNKIRKATVGYCPYCGTAIKVDQDGQVKIINRDDPDNT